MSSVGQARDFRIDAAKALAIILVVLGHARGIPHAFTILVYSFHVPLFFLLSGWVARAHGTERGFGETLVRLVRSLLLPYLLFFFTGYVYWLLTRHMGEKAARWGSLPWWDPVQGLVTGIGPDLYVNPVLWFLPVLFVTTLAAFLLRRVPVGILVSVALVVGLVWTAVFPSLSVRLPFGLDVLPIALVFYALGGWLAQRKVLPASVRGNALMALMLIAPWAVLAFYNGRVDINAMLFGGSVVLFFVNACLGTLIVLCLARLFEGIGPLRWIGQNTLVILCTHILIFFVLSGVASLAGMFRGDAQPGPAWAVFISIFALAASVPLRWILARMAPWSIGLRRKV
ncbi:acyltransferase [Pseudoxanthomonas sp. GM95]|uniref:acyltransferase family protein n=1 Tax=Pseudoxanthomonas sp. GM95 TaxID=1881043 RepID=UPI0008C20CB6|nr:acyltransferase family protein [Pseudoxanthomonas sp. GM95]SEK80453.1 acyltransferase [Pseudoxanthomonas sp. GM95]